MTRFDKSEILDKVLQVVEGNLGVLVDSAIAAKEFSTNEESKAENKYDTRGLEASYLASGQAQRAQKLQEQIYLLKKVNLQSYSKEASVGIGSVIELHVNESLKKHLFVLPSGGVEVHFGDIMIQTITIESPIGMNIHQQVVGHEFELNGKIYEVVDHY